LFLALPRYNASRILRARVRIRLVKQQAPTVWPPSDFSVVKRVTGGGTGLVGHSCAWHDPAPDAAGPGSPDLHHIISNFNRLCEYLGSPRGPPIAR
jgi:hypothetical protein